MNTICSKIDAAEQRISDVEDSSIRSSKDIKSLLAMTSSLKKQAAELEDRNRRGNIQIFGIPEGSEDSAESCISFLEDWIPQITGIKFHKNLELD